MIPNTPPSNTNASVPSQNSKLPDREPQLGIAVGKKGVGKSYTTMMLMRRYLAGAGGTKPRKVLIFDVNDEFTDVKPISIKLIPEFAQQSRPEMRRVRIFKEPSGIQMTLDEMADVLNDILMHYRRGFLLVEDLSKYTSDSYKRDIIGAICTLRHRDVDMMLHFQTIGKLGHPKIWGNVNYVRLHKTTDKVDKHKNKFGEYEHLKIAECLVNQEYDKGNVRFSCYINMDLEKISGPFTKQAFIEAIENYISENESETLKIYLRKRTPTGAKQYDYNTAMNACKEKLFTQYYGNL